MHDVRKAITQAMDRAGINANQLHISTRAKFGEAAISRSQIYDYISGKSDLGTDKARQLLQILRIHLVDK